VEVTVKRLDLWRLALLASLPALTFGACTNNDQPQGCGSQANCTTAADCTPFEPCLVPVCVGGHCGGEPRPDGTACSLDAGPAVCVGGQCLPLPSEVPGGDAGTDGGTSSCAHCHDALVEGSPGALCASSTSVYEALTSCICGAKCGIACGDNLCAQMPPTVACDDCVASLSSGCAAELEDCYDDR
jgi:hypothetical protein